MTDQLTIPERFHWFIQRLVKVISEQTNLAIRSGTLTTAMIALFTLADTRLRRTAARLQQLYIRWRAGTLPKPRPSRAGQPRKPRERIKEPVGKAWLLKLAQPTAQYRSALEQLLADPEFIQFLRDAPQAGRLLRPLCRMLAIEPTPEPLHIPGRHYPPPRPPKPARPQKPVPPQPQPTPTQERKPHWYLSRPFSMVR